jgi:RNA polymerase sigma factor (TIGR02999 family)
MEIRRSALEPSRPGSEITVLLGRIREGDQQALNQLVPLVYGELHRIARSALRGDRNQHTLQPTALLNEAFLRLFGGTSPQFSDRAHFLGISARIMRQVLVDYARGRAAQKRGPGLQVEFQESLAQAAPVGDLLEVDQALDRLNAEDPRLVVLIEMRFFAGMTAEETAEARSESVNVVRHDLRYAQARLRRLLGGSPTPA